MRVDMRGVKAFSGRRKVPESRMLAAREPYKCGLRAVQVWLVSRASVVREPCKCGWRRLPMPGNCTEREGGMTIILDVVRGILAEKLYLCMFEFSSSAAAEPKADNLRNL